MGVRVLDDLERHREKQRLKALIVDDDEGIRRLLKAVLELDGWEVHTAVDGDEAVAMAELYEPDAVLLDIMMPTTDGMTALRRIRESETTHDIPVMMVSALGDAQQIAEATEAGADDYMVKPVDAEGVSDRLLRMLDGLVDHEAEFGAEPRRSAELDLSD